MRNAIIMAFLCFALCAACQSGPTYEMGGAADEEVKRALADAHEGGAAISTGRMVYLVPQGELVEQRRKLISTLAGAEVIAWRWDGLRDVTVVSRAEARVMAFARPQVFETELDAGTLHVERLAEPGKPPTHYEVSLIDSRRAVTSRLKVSPRLEGAWRALFDAARRAGKTYARLGGLSASADRPLSAMRDIGVDLRGIESE